MTGTKQMEQIGEPKLKMTWKDIGGWFNYSSLYAAAVKHAPPKATFVEIGCWLGRSMAFLAQEVKDSGKDIKLFAIDTWADSEGGDLIQTVKEYEESGFPLVERFKRNLQRCGVRDMVNMIVSDSAEAAVNFQDRSLDFVFIDADHRYEACKRDIEVWLPKVKIGGLLAGHDFDRLEVFNAVRDVLGLGATEWKQTEEMIQRIWVFNVSA